MNKRFWSKVDIRGPDECWEWRASRTSNGYGYFRHKGRNGRAHRVAWELERGQIPNGLLVCHHCDNKICCNPGHLFMGTYDNNNKDMARKGRARSGMGPGMAGTKLTKEEAEEIRMLYGEGYLSQRQLAAMFGVHQTHVGRIVRREQWK